MLTHLKKVELTVVIGRYAIDWHIKPKASSTLANVVAGWRDHAPALYPLPHPSPRNTLWLKKHPWVEEELVPELQKQVRAVLS